MQARSVFEIDQEIYDKADKVDEDRFIDEINDILYKDIAGIVYSYYRYTTAKTIDILDGYQNVYATVGNIVLMTYKNRLRIYKLINNSLVNLKCGYTIYDKINVFRHENATYISSGLLYKLNEELCSLETVGSYKHKIFANVNVIDNVFFAFDKDVLYTNNTADFIADKPFKQTAIIDINACNDTYQFIRDNPGNICRIRESYHIDEEYKIDKEYIFYHKGMFYRYLNDHCILCDSSTESPHGESLDCQKSYLRREMKSLPSIECHSKIYINLPGETGLIHLENKRNISEVCCYQIDKNMILMHYMHKNKPMSRLYLLQ